MTMPNHASAFVRAQPESARDWHIVSECIRLRRAHLRFLQTRPAGGTFGNSPAIYRWAKSQGAKSPQGRQNNRSIIVIFFSPYGD